MIRGPRLAGQQHLHVPEDRINPVPLGEPLTVSIWLNDDKESAVFQTTREDGTVVIDRGKITMTQAPGPR